MTVVAWVWTCWRILGPDKDTVQEGDKNPLILGYFFRLRPALALDVISEAVDGVFLNQQEGQIRILQVELRFWGMRLIMGLFVMNF